MSKHKELSSARFGKLLVKARGANDDGNRATWVCVCDCGATKVVKAANLVRGRTRSCGCLGVESRKANGEKSGRAQCHAFSKSAMLGEYRSWEAMLDRCYKPSAQGFSNYGGRGIVVCDRWRESFQQFATDMGARPSEQSLDRIDTNGNYTPANCRWATRTEQANNRRNSLLLTARGQTMTLAQWSKLVGIAWHTLYNRFRSGWDAERIIGEQIKRHK